MEKLSRQVEDAIKGAIRLEIDGRKFFYHAAEITEHERGKKMFTFLAQEETRHLDTFADLFSRILKREDWKEYVRAQDVKGEAPLIGKLRRSMRREEGKGEVEALRIGMELEQNAIRFFEEAAREADDPVAKKIFREISEEEKFHYDLLQAQLDSVTKSGFWLSGAEFQMDGKF